MLGGRSSALTWCRAKSSSVTAAASSTMTLSCAPPLGLALGDDLDRPADGDRIQQALQEGGEAHAALPQPVEPDLANNARDTRTGAIARMGGFEICQPSAPSTGAKAKGMANRGDRVVAPPTTRADQRRIGPMALVDEAAADRVRARVDVLVVAPHGEVDVPVVQADGDVARRVGQVPSHEGSGPVRRGR